MRTKLATAARWARQRPRTNQQGIALQTVIVIVVMLVIAGAVSGVLLSRGSDVISDLEGADINATEIDTEDKCRRAGEALTGGAATKVTAAPSATDDDEWHWSAPKCSIAGVVGVPGTANAFGRFACEQYSAADGSRGAYTEGTAANSVKCIIG